jgi:hypothetical protein
VPIKRLQGGLLFLIRTGSAQIVDRFAIRHVCPQFEGKSFSVWKFNKLIPLHLGVPVFSLSQLRFKFPHPLGE